MLFIGDHKVLCQAHCDDFGASARFPKLVTTRLFPVFTIEKRSERSTIHEHWGSHCKSDKSTDRGVKAIIALTEVSKMVCRKASNV
jgi:hypothetical protein